MPFTKGDPNINRNGQNARGFSMIAILRRKLQEIPKGERKSNAEILLDKLIKDAKSSPRIDAAKEILDRIEGKPKQSVDTNVTLNNSISEIINELDDTTNPKTTK